MNDFHQFGPDKDLCRSTGLSADNKNNCIHFMNEKKIVLFDVFIMICLQWEKVSKILTDKDFRPMVPRNT